MAVVALGAQAQSGAGVDLTSGVFNTRLYGTLGNDDNNDTAGILAALAAAAPSSADGVTGIVYMPPGTYRISQKITVPNKVRLVGAGRSSTVIKAMSGFPADTPMVQLGVTGALAFGTRLESVFLFGEGIADLGVYSDCIQERSGLIDVGVSNVKKKPVWMASKTAQAVKAQNYLIEHVEASLATTSDVNAIGVHLECDGNAGKIQVEDITVNVADGVTNVPGVAFKFEGASGSFRNLHHEHTTGGGVVIGEVTPCIALTIDGIYGHSTVSDTVRIGNTQNDELTLLAVHAANAATCIRDNFVGLVFTDTRIGFYHTGIANNTGNPNYPLIKQTTISATLAAGNNNDYAIPAAPFSSSPRTGVMRLTGDGGGASAITGMAGGKHGRRIKIINVSANNIALPNESASSSAVNRLVQGSGATINLLQHDSAIYEYDSVTQRWRLESVQT